MTIVTSFEVQTLTKLKDLALDANCDCENPARVRKGIQVRLNATPLTVRPRLTEKYPR